MPELDPREKRAQALVGSVLKDKWRLDDVIGIGGMATVFGATHRNNGKRVAVKLLHPELSRIAQIRTRFLREGYASNQVDHPGAVAVLDDDVSDTGAVFLVMELLDGETLEQRRLSRGGRLDPLEVLWVADQLLDVLAAAHAKGIIHRDIKPDNLLLTRQGALKVLDFGLARVRPVAGAQLQGLTRTNMVMGTIEFMSPEQARGEWDTVDNRSDIWAIGATLFTLLTGAPVHTSPDPAEQLRSASSKPARSVSHLLPRLHAGVVRVVDRALAYRPDKRWPDARTMQLAAREVYTALKTGIELSAASIVAGGMVDEATTQPPDKPGPPRPGGRAKTPALRPDGAAGEPPAGEANASTRKLPAAGPGGAARGPLLGPNSTPTEPEPETTVTPGKDGERRASSHNLVGTIDSGVTTRWQVPEPPRPMVTSLETPTTTTAMATADSVVSSNARINPPPMRESSTPAFARPFPPPPVPAAGQLASPPPSPISLPSPNAAPPSGSHPLPGAPPAAILPPPPPRTSSSPRMSAAPLPPGALPPPPLPGSPLVLPPQPSLPEVWPPGQRSRRRLSAVVMGVLVVGILGTVVLLRISRASRSAAAATAAPATSSAPAASSSADLPVPGPLPPASAEPATSASADTGSKKKPPPVRPPPRRGPVKIRSPSK